MFDEDAALLEEAVATLRPAGRPFEFAGACEQASAWLARAGARQRSQSLFAHALTAYRSLGAARDIERMLAGRARWGEAIPLAHHRRAERQPAVAAPSER